MNFMKSTSRMTAQPALNLIDTDKFEYLDWNADIFCDLDSGDDIDLPSDRPEFTVGAGDLFPDWPEIWLVFQPFQSLRVIQVLLYHQIHRSHFSSTIFSLKKSSYSTL